MTAYSLIHQEAAQPRRRRAKRNGLVQLSWPHFWLLCSILGGMLALVGLIFLISLSPSF